MREGNFFFGVAGDDAVLGGQVAVSAISRVQAKPPVQVQSASPTANETFFALLTPSRCHGRRVRVSTRRSTGVSSLHDRGK
jgi:hypothetical protein